ncbi:DUF6662 family protein [Frateuria sp.]|uniref:DUF6662 family protein n=1 Tax=Frateuria sp. TaxID=2211372 RepID=UPI0025C6A05C|nr:DUF6662 family protein [Frateuria sp.]
MRLTTKAALAVLALLPLGSACAGESPFGWIYTADLHPQGRSEFEHKSWLQQGQSRGDYSYWKNAEEFEYGVTDRFQLSAYFNWSYVNAYRNGVDGLTGGPGTDLSPQENPLARHRKTRFDSVSVEAIYQVLNPLVDPIGLALYVEPEWGPHERALEWRIILQKNLLDDRFVLAANLLGESEHEKYYGEVERASMLDFSAGFSWRFTDNWSVGLETRNHQEFEGYRYDSREHSAWFLGPNLHYAAQRWWLTAAWRHQLPVVKAFNEEQREAVVGDRIYGDEHARNEFMLKLGIPF